MPTKIYVTEDQPLHAELIQTAFEGEADYQLSFFSDGLSVYQKVQEAPPDMMIMDIILPNLSGLAVTRLLKFHDRYAKIPILVVSSIIDPNIRDNALKCGADDFLPKPFQIGDLIDRVKKLLAKRFA